MCFWLVVQHRLYRSSEVAPLVCVPLLFIEYNDSMELSLIVVLEAQKYGYGQERTLRT